MMYWRDKTHSQKMAEKAERRRNDTPTGLDLPVRANLSWRHPYAILHPVDIENQSWQMAL